MARGVNRGKIKAVRPGAGVSMDPGLNPDQLKMLMTGSELKNQITYSPDVKPDRLTPSGEPESLEGMWPYKLGEAKRPINSVNNPGDGYGQGVYDSIKEKGYQGNPLVLRHHPEKGKFIEDGHHRVAAADALEQEGTPVYIPVVHQFR